MGLRSLVEQFYALRGLGECLDLLRPHLHGEFENEWPSVLMNIVKREDPCGKEKAEQARKAADESGDWDWGSGFAALMSGSSQRIAAMRLLAEFVDQREVFVFLWKAAIGRYSFSLGNIQNEAIVALSRVVPDHAEQFIERYKSSFDITIKIQGSDQRAAGAILIAGLPYCEEVLRARIASVIQFDYWVEEGVELTHNHIGTESPRITLRNNILATLQSIYFDSRHVYCDSEVVLEKFKSVFKEYLLDKFLNVFRDDATFYSQQIIIANAYIDDERVVEALCDFLDKCGGTFLATDETRGVLGLLSEERVTLTPRIVETIERLEARDMQDDIGFYSTHQILGVVREWRRRNTPDHSSVR